MYDELVKRLRNLSGTDNITEFDEAAAAIEELSKGSDDVAPVVHGEWQFVRKRLARGGYVDASKCSVCDKMIMPHLKPNYCPNCGARMSEEGT